MNITIEMIDDFIAKLAEEERECSTIEKYLRDIANFTNWLKNSDITHENCIKYKEELIIRGLKPSTINGMISALNITPSFMLT